MKAKALVIALVLLMLLAMAAAADGYPKRRRVYIPAMFSLLEERPKQTPTPSLVTLVAQRASGSNWNMGRRR